MIKTDDNAHLKVNLTTLAMTDKLPESATLTLTHFNASGEAYMVDVGHKPVTERIAISEGFVRMQPETLTLIASG